MSAPTSLLVWQVAAQAAFVTVCLGVALTLFLQNAASGRWLAATFAVFALIGLGEVLQAASVFSHIPVLGSLFWGLGPLLGPCVYLFVLRSTRPSESTLRWHQWLGHGALSLAFVGVTASYLLARGNPSSVWPPPDWPAYADARRILLGILLAQSLAYLLGALWHLHQHLRAMLGFVSNLEGRTLARRRFMLSALLLPWAVLLLEWVSSQIAGPDESRAFAGGLLRMGLIATLGVYAARHQTLLQPPLQEQVALAAADEMQGPRYERSPMATAEGLRILAKLDALMSEQQPWRDAALNLRKLSDLSGIPAPRITQALNVHGGRSFFGWVNEARVREAARLLRATDDPVLDIALAVGFNAKSTFNKAFRELLGTTPSAYRQGPQRPPPDPAHGGAG